MADVAVAKRGLGLAIWIGIDMGNMGGSLNGSPKPSEPLKIPWLIDCYRGLYYLVYWGL
jgi:hypothetical protein